MLLKRFHAAATAALAFAFVASPVTAQLVPGGRYTIQALHDQKPIGSEPSGNSPAVVQTQEGEAFSGVSKGLHIFSFPVLI